MSFIPKIETLGSGDQSWLGSRHGVENARTVTIDAASITDVKYAGIVKAGIPLKVGTGGKFVPLTDAALDTLAGFLLTDQPNVGDDIVAPMIDHGRVRVDRLPDQAPVMTAGVKGLFNLVESGE